MSYVTTLSCFILAVHFVGRSAAEINHLTLHKNPLGLNSDKKQTEKGITNEDDTIKVCGKDEVEPLNAGELCVYKIDKERHRRCEWPRNEMYIKKRRYGGGEIQFQAGLGEVAEGECEPVGLAGHSKCEPGYVKMVDVEKRAQGCGLSTILGEQSKV